MALNTQTYADSLNGRNLLQDFGMIIQTGTAQLLEYPERKERIKYDWPEENGTQYDLQEVRFKDREVTLRCAILADNDSLFWQSYNALFVELSKPGFQQLYIADHNMHYSVFYKKSGNFQKLMKRLKNVPKVFVKFDLTFQIAINAGTEVAPGEEIEK